MLDEDPSSLAGIGSESLCVATRSGRDEWSKSVIMSKVEVEDKDEARRFTLMHKAERVDTPDAETRLRREVDFDPDLWIVEVESRDGRTLLD